MSKDRDVRKTPWVGDFLTFGFEHYRVVEIEPNVVVRHRLGGTLVMTLEEYKGWAKDVSSAVRAK